MSQATKPTKNEAHACPDEGVSNAGEGSEAYVCHVNEEIEGSYYIGRANGRKRLKASPFANPFVIGRDGDRPRCIWRYAAHLTLRPDLIRRLPELRGHPLACFCRRSDEAKTEENRCHGDLLTLWLERYTDETLAAWPDLRQVPKNVLRRW